MKSILAIFLSLVFFTQVSTGQGPPKKIQESFSVLKSQMLKKAETLTELTSQYEKYQIGDSALAKETKATAMNLVKHLNRHTYFDSSYIQLISSINEYLYTLESLTEKAALKQNKLNKDVGQLRLKLEETENRIGILRDVYNSICRRYDRLDLVLKLERPGTDDTKIEF